MKLTEDNFYWSYSRDLEHYQIEIDNYPRFTNPFTKQQMDDIINEVLQNQILRELIEKEIESGQDGRIQSSSLFLQELLDRSKK